MASAPLTVLGAAAYDGHMTAVNARQRAEWLAPSGNALRDALRDRMMNDPKLAYEVVTGACCWPPINGEDDDDLASQAANLADDLETLAASGTHVPAFRIDQLRAAETVFCFWAASNLPEGE